MADEGKRAAQDGRTGRWSKEALNEVMARLAALEATAQATATAQGKGSEQGQGSEDRLALVVFSGSLDRQLAAFVLATGAAASGMQVEMFFTFWGLAALRDPQKKPRKDGLLERAFGWMLPRGLGGLPLSTMNLGGLGPRLIRRVMTQKGMASIEEMRKICGDFGVRLWSCDMSRELLGISPDELVDYPHLGHCGVAQFLAQASRGRVTMFI